MGELLARVTTPMNLTLAAASSASDAVLDLIDVAREGAVFDVGGIASEFYARETAEKLADALQSVLSIQNEAGRGEPQLLAREQSGQLLAAVSRFLEGWA